MKQEEKHVSAMVHAMIQVREKVKKLSAENEQLKAELDQCKLDQIEFLTEHPTYKLSKELEEENDQLKAKLEKACGALRFYERVSVGEGYGDLKFPARVALKEIE